MVQIQISKTKSNEDDIEMLLELAELILKQHNRQVASFQESRNRYYAIK
jgi:hypothetical protein